MTWVAAVVQVWSLAQELLHALCEAKKEKKKKKKKKKKLLIFKYVVWVKQVTLCNVGGFQPISSWS